jgi:type II secretory pathway pseudopilin PulG
VSAPVKKRMSRRAQVALVLVALLAVAALGYLALVAPKRAAASELEREAAAIQARVAEYRAASPANEAVLAAKAAEVFKLAKAMPDTTDMSGVVLELAQMAGDTGIELDAITPGAPTTGTDYQALPITVVFRGDFYSLSDLLYRLRTLVAVRDGRLSAHGRLFAVETITFSEDENKRFPHVKTELTVTAFVYGSGATGAAGGEGTIAGDGAAPAASSPTTTGSTTAPSNSSTNAAPAAAGGP